MSWKLAGSYFETCSCDVVCPCTASLSLGATHDRCRVVLVFRVRSGDVEGTDVSGLTVAAIVDSPKVMSEGNWRIGLFIDASAQAQELQGTMGQQRELWRFFIWLLFGVIGAVKIAFWVLLIAVVVALVAGFLGSGLFGGRGAI